MLAVKQICPQRDLDWNTRKFHSYLQFALKTAILVASSDSMEMDCNSIFVCLTFIHKDLFIIEILRESPLILRLDVF